MFRNRASTQKPNRQLYAAFKQSYPELVTEQNNVESTGPSLNHGSTSTASTAPSQPAMEHRHMEAPDDLRLHELTSRSQADPLRFTPSMLDPNSISFASFANQVSGYPYPPTPGGINAVYHNHAAGDLHTPGMALQLGTPLSMPMSEGTMATGPSFESMGFHPQLFQTPAFQQPNAFSAEQQAFPPSMLVHQDSGYVALEGSPPDGVGTSADMPQPAGMHPVQHQQTGNYLSVPAHINSKFRYHVTLNAPTAMTKHADEIPITYLNKGQAYTISIVDSLPLSPSPGLLKYRTVIRISFEDDEQRSRPSSCWQLWKEGRGQAESHQRGGRLQAVEFVDPHPGAEEDPRRPRIELSNSSFDSFVVDWSPPMAVTTADCAVAVRFNFLSTDFSHSKGVKGIPVRLCAKTEQISSGTPETPTGEAEVCYCKVKLFRDHGAERKLSNDVAHVKKTIEKLKQQIAQVESGMKDGGKRKRTASVAGKVGGERPSKIAKHKRTWSVSSQGSGGRPAPEEDLHQKLAAVQDMFTSTRPVSVLYLKGAEGDDPDAFPVSLPKDPLTVDTSSDMLRRNSSWDRRGGEHSETGSSMDSPLVSARTMIEKPSTRKSSAFRLHRHYSGDWPLSATLPATDFAGFGLTSEPTKVRKRRGDDGNDGPQDWIDALGVDPSYVPPPERTEPPAACVYVRARDPGSSRPADEFYRAVYLRQRSVAELVRGITRKYKVDAGRVGRVYRIDDMHRCILVDEDVMQELSEGQDLIVEFHDATSGVGLIKSEANAVDAGSGKSFMPGATHVDMVLFF